MDAPDPGGQAKLARRLRELRLQRRLSQEALAERASMIDPDVAVSVDTVRALERVKTPRPLPRRRPARGRFALELLLEALDADVAETLCACFHDEELQSSSFAWVPERRRERLREFDQIVNRASLAEFIAALPIAGDELLKLPGVLNLFNAEAFSYIFALERFYAGLEMLLVNEPPIVLLLDDDVATWAGGMGMNARDAETFTAHVREYRSYFLKLAVAGEKRYQVVLSKRGLERFLRRQTKDRAAAFLHNAIAVLDRAPSFEMVLLDSPRDLEEVEVISRHQAIPTSLADTLSVVIRQNSMTAERVEYCLVPMPPLLSSLQRDIANIEHHWSLALDQYRAMAPPTDYWLNVTGLTTRMLEALVPR